MAEDLLIKLSPRTPAELCAAVELDLVEEAAPLLEQELTPSQFLRALIAGGHLTDAARYLAYALPAREALWWGCLCARSLLDDGTPPAQRAAIEAAEAWVFKPDEDRRRAAQAAAEAAGPQTPAGLVGMGVFCSGGSLVPPEFEAVPPAPELAGKMVAAAVVICAVSPPPQKAEERLRGFLAKGIEIAMGRSGQKGAGDAPSGA